ncbi:GNAT family N-acetyltransferase [Streptomyces sp. CC208A]|uniref:GNAT family N-acetyltransferase n=1 Tax=Streptomyces sp. CC208A TaxID=3044573 RepID=UPI0024A8B77C|nr:GNAT family N-acetyltransferase [Streptomyces sp. CC208A]
MKIENTPVAVRRRTEDDLGACVRLLREVHEHDGYPVSWPERPASWITPPTFLGAWVAELDGRVVGHAGLAGPRPGDGAPVQWSLRTGAGVEATAMVNRLYVSPSARGHGIGALLLAKAVEAAREHGLHPVLDVAAHDAAATALYERLGWELLATVGQEWGPHGLVAVRTYAAPSGVSPRPAPAAARSS